MRNSMQNILKKLISKSVSSGHQEQFFTKISGFGIALFTLTLATAQIALPSMVRAEMVKPVGEIVAFTKQNWKFIGDTKVVDHLGRKALRFGVPKPGAPVGFGLAARKAKPFSNGIIEYDLAFAETRTFGGLRFHTQGHGNYEEFYMRGHLSGKPDANQYMPAYNHIPSWQLYFGKQYSAPTKYRFNKWMHVKLVISDDLADIFIMDMTKPANTVRLKREEKTGGLALWGLDIDGPVWISNFAVKATNNVNIMGTPVPEKPATSGTITSWMVSNTFDGATLKGKTQLPKGLIGSLKFQQLSAEKTGMTNLAKLSGVKKSADTVFAKLTVNSASEQIKKFSFGFSDKARIYINGKAVFVGNDAYSSRDYRFLGTVGFYDSVFLPLNKGNNEIMIAVTEATGLSTGWAVQGRFEDMSGLTVR